MQNQVKISDKNERRSGVVMQGTIFKFKTSKFHLFFFRSFTCEITKLPWQRWREKRFGA